MRYVTEITPLPKGTTCCGNDPKAIYFNPYNQVVQCHACGHVYEPKPTIAETDSDAIDPTVTSLSPASAAPVVDNLEQVIADVIRHHHTGRTHSPTYCCPEDEAFYDRQLVRMLVEKLTSAAATPAPVEQSEHVEAIDCYAPYRTSSSTSARAAAEEIVKAWLWHTPEHDQERARVSVAALIERRLEGAR